MFLLSALLVVASCGGDDGSGETGLAVVATTTIWGDVVSQVVGDGANVEVLTPLGADAHDFQPSPQQVAAIQGADLVVTNGLGLEEGLADVLAGAAGDGVDVLELAPELDPIEFGHRSQVDDETGDGAHEQELDPHVWFDPLRVSTAADLMAERLAAIDSSGDWQKAADEYGDSLQSLDAEITEVLSSIGEDQRKLVTNHEALGYFADRYDFEIVGVVVPGGSTIGDPSSAEMAALVETIEHEGVDTIFAETSQPTDLAEAVAAEVGSEVAVVELYTESLGAPGSGAETLVSMLMVNAERIAAALRD